MSSLPKGLVPDGVPRDPYKALGLEWPKSANEAYTENDLRRAYRRRALELHPDKNPNDELAEGKFTQLGVALEYLLIEDNRVKLNSVIFGYEEQRRRALVVSERKRKFAKDLAEREAAFNANRRRRYQTDDQSRGVSGRVSGRQMEFSTTYFDQEAFRKARSLQKSLLRHQGPGVKERKYDPKIYILDILWQNSSSRFDDRDLINRLSSFGPFRMLWFDSAKARAQVQMGDRKAAWDAALALTERASSESEEFIVRLITRDDQRTTAAAGMVTKTMEIDENDLADMINERLINTKDDDVIDVDDEESLLVVDDDSSETETQRETQSETQRETQSETQSAPPEAQPDTLAPDHVIGETGTSIRSDPGRHRVQHGSGDVKTEFDRQGKPKSAVIGRLKNLCAKPQVVRQTVVVDTDQLDRNREEDALRLLAGFGVD